MAMEIKKINKKENKLLNRIEITAEIHHKGISTPKRLELKKQLSAKLGAKEELLAIKKIEPTFSPMTIVHANLYSKSEDLQKIEPKYIIKRLEKAQKKAKKVSQEQKPTKEKEPEGKEKPAENASPEEKPEQEHQSEMKKPIKEKKEGESSDRNPERVPERK